MTITLIRRTGAVLTSAGLATALTLLSPVSAHAVVHGTFEAERSANATYTGTTLGGTCPLTAGHDEGTSSEVHFNHGTRHRSLDLDATFTSSDSAADTVRVKGHAASTLTLKRRHRDLASATLAVGGSVTITHSIHGSSCRGSGVVGGATQVVFTEHTAGWFYLTHDVKKSGATIQVAVIDSDARRIVTSATFEGGHSHQTSRVKLKPGNYALVIEAGVSRGAVGLSRSALVEKTALTTTVAGTFKPIKKH